MAEQTIIQTPPTSEPTVDRHSGFWAKNSKPILIAIIAAIAVLGGIFGYKYFIAEPNEKKAAEASFRAEEYFRQDSLNLALNGDNSGAYGFLKVISKYGSTKAGNLAHFYAGASYLRLGDYKNAAKYLEDFSTNSPQIQAKSKALLADSYSELGKFDDAVKLYREAGTAIEKDDYNSPQYLFKAGYLYEKLGKNKEAIEMYKLIKEKYPQYTEFDVDKYLGRLGAID